MKKVNEVGANIMLVISGYMDSDLRQKVAYEVAPCTNEVFLKKYCELDESFADLLKEEFGIEL